MIKNLFISNKQNGIDRQTYEIVERKGLGHPDTLADGIAESFSIEYSKYCLSRFGVILNHWVDKTLLTGGLSEVGYGRGELLKPINLYFFGKISKSFAGKIVDLERISALAIQNFLSIALPRLNIDKDLIVNFLMNDYSRNPRWMNPQTKDDLPNSVKPRSNDTSVGVGFYPFSRLEKLVLKLEKYFYDKNLKQKNKFFGNDIKILAVRNNNKINVTMCVPFISAYIPNEKFYFDLKNSLKKNLLDFAMQGIFGNYQIDLSINNEDSLSFKDLKKRKGHYFLVTGSALDDGEVGLVGRGNPASGVISLYRPHSMEAPYGKNPVYHVGKVYTYLAHVLARKISVKFNNHVTVIISSRMGDKLNEPNQIIINSSKKVNENIVKEIINRELVKKQWALEIINSKFFIPKSGQNMT